MSRPLFLALLLLSACAYDPLGVVPDAGSTQPPDAGEPLDGGSSEDAGHFEPYVHSLEFGTVGRFPPRSGARLREARIHVGARLCKEVDGVERCVTAGITP